MYKLPPNPADTPLFHGSRVEYLSDYTGLEMASPIYKSAPNRVERNKILDMYAEGRTAKQISEVMRIKLSSVENYAPKKKPGRPKKEED